MKFLNVIAWITGLAAGILVLLAFIALLLNVNLFGVRHEVNYFHAANTLLLIAICSTLYRLTEGKKKD